MQSSSHGFVDCTAAHFIRFPNFKKDFKNFGESTTRNTVLQPSLTDPNLNKLKKFTELPYKNHSKSSYLQRHASACDLTMGNYSYSGEYWCSACSSVAEGSVYCNPSETAPPSTPDMVR